MKGGRLGGEGGTLLETVTNMIGLNILMIKNNNEY